MKKFLGLWMITTTLFMASSYAMEIYRTETLVGIGATLDREPDGGIQVRALIAGAPAEKAGIRPGDLILELRSLPGSDVIRVREHSMKEVIALIRGPRGVPVELLIQRGSEEPTIFSVIRDRFEVGEDQHQ